MKNRHHIEPVIIVASIVAVLPVAASADKVYKWTDVQGNVSYQDHPPPAEAAKSETKEINPEDITTKFEPPARVPASAASPPPSASTPAQAPVPPPSPTTKRIDEEMLRKIMFGAGASTSTGSGTGSTPLPPAALPQIPTALPQIPTALPQIPTP